MEAVIKQPIHIEDIYYMTRSHGLVAKAIFYIFDIELGFCIYHNSCAFMIQKGKMQMQKSGICPGSDHYPWMDKMHVA